MPKFRRPRNFFQLTRPVFQWLQSDKDWRGIALDLRLRMHLAAQLASLNASLSRRFLSDKSFDQSALPESPVFVLGPWRSGTTFMHELLVTATELPTPRTWQCMNATSFMLLGSSGNTRIVKRPMDEFRLSARSPQEDEFALLTLGIPSAYRAMIMPHRISSMEYILDQDYWLNDPSWLSEWAWFLLGVMNEQSGEERGIILKSPGHTYRIQAIMKYFPKARAVWIERNPIDVFLSNRKMWKSMFAIYGLSGHDELELDQFLFKAIVRANDTLKWCQEVLPSTRLAVVNFDRLREDPMRTVAEVLTRLSMPSSVRGQSRMEALAGLHSIEQSTSAFERLPRHASEMVDKLKELYGHKY